MLLVKIVFKVVFSTAAFGTKLLPRSTYAVMAAKQQTLEHEELFVGVTELVRDYLIKCNDRSSKVKCIHTLIENNMRCSF